MLRKCSQIFFLGIFVYILWSTTYPLKGLFSPKILFNIDPLVMFFAAISERVLLSGLIFSSIMLGLTFIFGRFFCGWLCPLGTLIDCVGAFRKKKVVLKDAQNAKVRKGKFVILGLVIFFAVIGVQIAWIFDPIVILARVISLNIIPSVTFAANNFFIFFIKKFELYGAVYDFYRTLKGSFLGINIHFFSNSLIAFIFFLIICIASMALSRAWCRALCPLGALYSMISKFSLLKRVARNCFSCSVCHRHCRMGAIKNDTGSDYVKGECILCMDCIYNCPQEVTYFSFARAKNSKTPRKENNTKGISRKEFFLLLFSSLPLLGFVNNPKVKRRQKAIVIRPPGALKEGQFLDICIRCGNCMKVCITNGLQPIMFQSGFEGIWTPQLVPEIGYCEYKCTLCGNVCPTDAILKLSVQEKIKIKLGVAEINRSICIAWAEDKECIVCEEHCPVDEKAIKVKAAMVNGREILKPYVDEILCVGCGICQNKCPVSPVRAIRVNPAGSQRKSLK